MTDAVDPALPTQDGHALKHVTEQTRTYPCRACGGELEFHIGQQKLVCPHCGGEQELVEAADRAVVEKDLRAAVAELRSRAADSEQLVAGTKEVVCQNCGGHTTFTGTLTATRCPYCATPIQRDDVHDAPARLSVDGVLPFRMDRKQAEERLAKWVSSRWFAPSEFKTYHRTGSFASVYAAYFTYDADTATRYRGERGDDYTVEVGSGDNRRTETRTEWRRVSGTVRDEFDDLPVLANDGFDRTHVAKLEPWPTKEVKPYSPEYVAGHLCRTYDRDVEACFGEAEQRMEQTIEGTIRRDIGGDHQRIHSRTTTYRSLSFMHLLLPIWLLTVIYDGKPFQVVMNGVTGQTHGERPWSKVKLAVAAAVALAVVVVVVMLVQGRGAG
jgi:DNA-directed RNA polymerase subunit RPC12/RpoP